MHESRQFHFLGTGAGDANYGTPESTQLPIKDQRRYVSNYLAPDLLIDFNQHTHKALTHFGVAPESIKYLVVSHGHFDHFDPLEIIRFAATLPQPLQVFGNSMVVEALDFCRDNVFDEASGRFVSPTGVFNLVMTKLVVGEWIEVGDVRFTPVLGNHFMNKPYNLMEQQSLNFLIEVGDKTLFYGLDSSYMIPASLSMISGIHLDIAITDATFGPLQIDPVGSGHHNWVMLDETIAQLRQAGCIDGDTVIVADHLSVNNIRPHDEVAVQQAAKGITLAYDGLTLTL